MLAKNILVDLWIFFRVATVIILKKKIWWKKKIGFVIKKVGKKINLKVLKQDAFCFGISIKYKKSNIDFRFLVGVMNNGAHRFSGPNATPPKPQNDLFPPPIHPQIFSYFFDCFAEKLIEHRPLFFLQDCSEYGSISAFLAMFRYFQWCFLIFCFVAQYRLYCWKIVKKY